MEHLSVLAQKFSEVLLEVQMRFLNPEKYLEVTAYRHAIHYRVICCLLSVWNGRLLL